MGEANLSTQEAQAHAHARVPGPDVDPGRASGHQGSPPEGSPQADGLTAPTSPRSQVWRIRDRRTFEGLAVAPRRRRGPVSLSFLPGDGESPPRVAFAVGRRVGPAVTRNRVRRRLRASVARHRATLRPGGTYLIGAGPAAAAASFEELDASVAALLARAGR